ncbi:hypothetical protein GCM10023317_67210 [Actinopolymorpha pittospori]
MQDAGDLAHHDHPCSSVIERTEQRERVEAERIVAGHRADNLVGVVMPNARRRPIAIELGESANRLPQPSDRIAVSSPHSSASSSFARVTACSVTCSSAPEPNAVCHTW